MGRPLCCLRCRAVATGFVQPELRLVHDDEGQVVDVKVFYPKDLAAQMLRWSGRAR